MSDLRDLYSDPAADRRQCHRPEDPGTEYWLKQLLGDLRNPCGRRSLRIRNGMLFGVPVFAVIYRSVKRAVEHSLKKKDVPVNTSDFLKIAYLDPVTGEPVSPWRR